MILTDMDLVLIFLYFNINMSVFYVDQQEFLIETREKARAFRGCFYCQMVLLVNTFIVASHFIFVLIAKYIAGERVAVMTLGVIKILHFPLYAILYVIKKIESSI